MSVDSARKTGWLEDRLGLRRLMSRLLAGAVEPRWAWLRTTGMICFVLILVECVTGPILGVYYTPSPTAAYNDTLAIEQNPMGRFLRGLHHWSSAALILLSLFTVVRMFFKAEYRGRRDVVWIAAVLFFQLVLFFQISGHAMPWDTNAVSTIGVEAGIAGNMWVVGPTLKRLILGGSATGAATLTRWYGVHALLLPLATLLVIALPLILNRLRHGEADTRDLRTDGGDAGTDRTSSHTSEPYYPNHLFREMVAAFAVFCVIAGLALFVRPPLDKEATAANLSGYRAMSEWYVLPMHAATLIPPFNDTRFEPLATLVGPGVLFGVLLVLPFVDRNRERSMNKRRFAVACGAVTIIATLGLYVFAWVTERPQVDVSKAPPGPTSAVQLVVDPKLAELGKALYGKNGCNTCHAISGTGGKSAPDLSKTGTAHPDRDWQVQHLVKPDSKVPGSSMPAYDHLKQDELKALAEYLVSLR